MEEDKIIDEILKETFKEIRQGKSISSGFKVGIKKALQKGIIIGVKKEADIQLGRLKEDIIDDIVIPNIPPSLHNDDSSILYKIADDCFDEGCKYGMRNQSSKIAELEEKLNKENQMSLKLARENEQFHKLINENYIRMAELEKTIATGTKTMHLWKEKFEKYSELQIITSSKKDKRIAELEAKNRELEYEKDRLNKAVEAAGPIMMDLCKAVEIAKEERKQLAEDFQFLIDQCVPCTCNIEDWGTDLTQHESSCDMVTFNQLLTRLKGEE